MSTMVSFVDIGTLAGDDKLRQMKNAVIIFTSLVCRAAVRGGLPAETAYTLADR